MTFLTESFLLESKAAERLYHEYAAPEPIFDYHCHLVPRMIAENRRFHNLFEIWLEGDHYKWRAMRASGVSERFCTGDATPYEKFLAWARTVPSTLRNPLYHWTHLELQRYFGIPELLNEDSAPRIWQQANEILQTLNGGLDVWAILKKFNVHTIGTTDDPADALTYHQRIAAAGPSQSLATRVVPTFRPDACLRVDEPATFNLWIDRLAATADIEITTFATFLDAIEKRQQEFHTLGCRMSDHGLDISYAGDCSEDHAAAIFTDARNATAATSERHHAFASFMMFFLGSLYARSNWTMQLHLGALRNVNSRAKAIHGPDTGFDTMGGATTHGKAQLPALAAFLDKLETANSLPKTIVYNSNPIENYAFATLTGSFSAENVPGKVQFGSGWWFLDQKEGIELQLNALSNVSLLSRFVGMVTDSRSFMSYPRHEYFRRVLCNLLGGEIERGLLPGDFALVGKMVRDISFHNAHQYAAIPALEPAIR
jgi:glucuronate isomerase